VKSRAYYLYSLMQKYKGEKPADAPKLDAPGKWFYSRLHSRIRAAPAQFEALELRSLSLSIFYDTINDLQWYAKRSPRAQLREFFEYWTLLIAPFMPHVAEEFWRELGEKHYVKDAKFASIARFPAADESRINPSLDEREEYLRLVLEDIMSIKRLIKMEANPSSITLIVHAPYKVKVRKLAAELKSMQAVMQKAKEDSELAPIMPKVSALAAKYLKNIAKLIGKPIGADAEFETLDAARQFISSEFGGAKVEIIHEQDAPGELAKKADFAQPGRPSIIIS
jgi:leucyl-tRNA synthetase